MKVVRKRTLKSDGTFGSPIFEIDISHVPQSEMKEHLQKLKTLMEEKRQKDD